MDLERMFSLVDLSEIWQRADDDNVKIQYTVVRY